MIIIFKLTKYNKSNMEDESFQLKSIKNEIDQLILERSKYLISKKFEKYKIEILKIYSQFNINKSRRIDALGAPKIDVNNLDKIIISILKEINLFILELSSPKDIFISFFLITSQKENEMEGIIKNIQNEIISKNLTEKYNNIFYEEKIKPMFIKYEINNKINKNELEEDEIINIVNIGEYNSKGKKIKSMNELFEENENNIKEYHIKNQIIDKNKSVIINNNIKKNDFNFSYKNDINQNTLYIETLPQILIDYLFKNPNLAFVEIDEEFNKELKILNKKILYKIKEYDDIYSKNKNIENNINKVGKELNQLTLQLNHVKKNIDLYEQIIMDKKEKRENIIFLEDMLNKLKEKEKVIINKIDEIKENSFIFNLKDKFSKYNNNDMTNRFKDNNYNLIQNLNLSSTKNNNNSNNNITIKEIPKLSLNYNKYDIFQKKCKITPKYKLTNSTTNINKITKLGKFNNSLSESKMTNINKNALTTKNSILKTISSKEKDNQMFNDDKTKRKTTTVSIELLPETINIALNEIFSFYSSLNNNINMSSTNINNDSDNNNTFIYFNSFKKFCSDFKIFISEPKIESIFYEFIFNINDDNNVTNKNIEEDNISKINFNQFKSSLSKLSLEMHEIKKQKLKKLISDKKNIINYMELREYLRQEEEKNHNKFTEKITGGTAKKSLEKNQFEFLSKYKKLKTEISKYEFDYEKESKKSEEKILDNFYQFLGIGNNNYKNKIKIKSNIFVENALKKYGYMDIFKNFQNTNNISIATGYNNNNLSSMISNKNNPFTMRLSKKNLFNNKYNNFKLSNSNNNFNFINNINSNIFNNNEIQNNYTNNNIGNNRYNVKSIEDLEEIDNYKGINNKQMNKNFSAVQLKGKTIIKMNNINNDINILPSISNINSVNKGYNNIRFKFSK